MIVGLNTDYPSNLHVDCLHPYARPDSALSHVEVRQDAQKWLTYAWLTTECEALWAPASVCSTAFHAAKPRTVDRASTLAHLPTGLSDVRWTQTARDACARSDTIFDKVQDRRARYNDRRDEHVGCVRAPTMPCALVRAAQCVADPSSADADNSKKVRARQLVVHDALLRTRWPQPKRDVVVWDAVASRGVRVDSRTLRDMGFFVAPLWRLAGAADEFRKLSSTSTVKPGVDDDPDWSRDYVSYLLDRYPSPDTARRARNAAYHNNHAQETSTFDQDDVVAHTLMGCRPELTDEERQADLELYAARCRQWAMTHVADFRHKALPLDCFGPPLDDLPRYCIDELPEVDVVTRSLALQNVADGVTKMASDILVDVNKNGMRGGVAVTRQPPPQYNPSPRYDLTPASAASDTTRLEANKLSLNDLQIVSYVAVDENAQEAAILFTADNMFKR